MLDFLVRTHEEKGLRIEFGYPGEETPLHSAAEAGSLECAQLLVSHGASVHARNHWRWTPFFSAAANPKAIPVVKFLIDSGADINAADGCEELPIWQAALHDNLEGVRLLCQLSDLKKRNHYEETVLHHAAYGGSLEKVQCLANAGADITARSKSNSSVLHRAAEAGKSETVKWLLDAHASHFGVNDTTSYGWTPLLFAACRNHTDTVKILLERGADVDLLIQHGADVLAQGTDRSAMSLQENGEELQREVHNMQQRDKESLHQPLSPSRPVLPLHCAACVGNLAKAEVLLNHSDNSTVNTQDMWGRTSLHDAAAMRHLEFLRFLISRDGDINVRNDDDRTVLQYLSFYNGPDIARSFLMERGLYDPFMEEKDLNVEELKRTFRRRYLGV